MAIAAGFGVLVGTFVLAARGRQTLTVLVPVLSAMAVSALSFEAVERGAADPGLRTLIAPLVTFLPGGVLTTATVELASGEMVAGASRLVFGSVQLLAARIRDRRRRRARRAAERVGARRRARRTCSAGGRRGWA